MEMIDAEDSRTIGVLVGVSWWLRSLKAHLALAFRVTLGLWLPRRIEDVAVMVDNGVMVYE
jgi:hypothetical protein